MKHFDYTALYKEIQIRQKKELITSLQKFPNHEFHFGLDYVSEEQAEVAEFPFIIGYFHRLEEPADLKVLAIKEKKGNLSILVRNDLTGEEEIIVDLDLQIVLGQLENIIDVLPDKE